MKHCINLKSNDFKNLAKESNIHPAILAAKMGIWQDENNTSEWPTLDQLDGGISYVLKAADILLSDKAEQVFAKGNKNNWSLDKILTELSIPKEQKQLLLELGIADREQLAIELQNRYGYNVEVRTSDMKYDGLKSDNQFEAENRFLPIEMDEFKEKLEIAKERNIDINEEDRLVSFNLDGIIYQNVDNEFEKWDTTKEKINKGTPTQYYSNLTSPGGTNYTENEISTPLITPSIKGHAQFSTDKGIGWFRSDDKAIYTGIKKVQDALDDNNNPLFINEDGSKDIPTKTRRILEVQSDLFQKGRDQKDLTGTYRENVPGVGEMVGLEVMKRLKVNKNYLLKNGIVNPEISIRILLWM